jgi:NitT/TauT family transport system permease protein
MPEPWFAVARDLSPRRQAVLTVGAFVLPLLLWCVLSYVPFIWHPLITVTAPGGSTFLAKDMMIERGLFAEENAKLILAGLPAAEGFRSNPVFLPPPHAVARALATAFVTPPVRKGEPWLHESLWHSLTIILWGFSAAALLGVPVGVLCGTFSFFSRLVEPFVDFIRYMPAPAFGALMVAVCGINDGPKIAIIFIGTFFQLVLVVANTTRLTDRALLEAAQTLGARGRHLVTHVVLPGILPNLYNDLRILLGWAWTYLIVAELIGASSGISYFINQQGKYRNYDNVFAGIILIGLIGLVTDQVLAILGRVLFPWQGRPPGRLGAALLGFVRMLSRRSA